MSSVQNIVNVVVPLATQYPNIERSRGIHLDYSPMTYEDQRCQVDIAGHFGRSTIFLSPARGWDERDINLQSAAERLNPTVEKPKRIGLLNVVVKFVHMMRRSIMGNNI